MKMKEFSKKDFENYIIEQNEVLIEDGKKSVKISVGKPSKIKEFSPDNFKLEITNVWSFPKRGKWATHGGQYRGNWAPEIPRNLLLRYSEQGDVILDQFVGSGTTLIECKLLGRNGIGIDVNTNAIVLTRDRLNFHYEPFDIPIYEQCTYLGNASNLDLIKDNSIDLIATHPPYANIIRYSKDKIQEDLSNVKNINEYILEMEKVAKESYRVLKSGKYAAILIGDTRRNKHHIPIAFRVMQAFLKAGFILKEDIIKIQHQMKGTTFWAKRSQELNFLLLKHEHLFVFRKPNEDEKTSKFKFSKKWW
jgi:DNA modification methylase